MKKGFTLIELLVVVLIIGILAAIALPQYQKAVLKAKLHTGIPLVESLYQAQQAYKMANGDFASDIDDLAVDVPGRESCTKTQNIAMSKYACKYGTIGIYDTASDVQYIVKGSAIAYLHYLKDYESGDLERKAGEVWCFAETENKAANQVCKSMGGTFGNSTPNSWTRYKIR
ncbi:MAG: prepilin-type N-terminal cleavage/methylation domain-containing protein [Elusimicrobiaceae bacterium]|nr:prepilin-type N-terminal cleavage/methylation domain-containing protein [Elusimicrobiaceae bacterium]